MSTTVQNLRTSDPAQGWPVTVPPGSLVVNTANRQLAVGDADSGALGTPLPLIAVTVFDTRAIYGIGNHVLQAGQLWVAIAANGPGAFNPLDWGPIAAGGGGGSAVIITVTQANTFTAADVGKPLYYSGSLWTPALADDVATLGYGLLQEVISGTELAICTSGQMEVDASQIEGGAPMSAGQFYYVSDTLPGILTPTEPTAFGHFSNPMLLALSGTEALVLPYRANVILDLPVSGADAVLRAPADAAQNTITPTADHVPLTVVGIAGQLENMQEWRNSADQVLLRVGPDGLLEQPGVADASATGFLPGFGTLTRAGLGRVDFNTSTVGLRTEALAATFIPLQVHGHSSQSVNLTEWHGTAPTPTRISSDGTLRINDASSARPPTTAGITLEDGGVMIGSNLAAGVQPSWRFGGSTPDFGGAFTFQNNAGDGTVIRVRASPSQSAADLTQWVNGNGDLLTSVQAGGQIAMRDGTATQPSLRFANDLDVGMYRISNYVGLYRNLFVGNANGVNITNAPTCVIFESSSGRSWAAGSTTEFIVERNADCGITVCSGSGKGSLNFGDPADEDAGAVNYDHSNNQMTFRTNGSDRFHVNSAGRMTGINGDAPAPTYAFTGDTNTGMYRANVDNIGMATTGIRRFVFGVGSNVTYLPIVDNSLLAVSIAGGAVPLTAGLAEVMAVPTLELAGAVGFDFPTMETQLPVAAKTHPTSTEEGTGVEVMAALVVLWHAVQELNAKVDALHP